MDETPRTRTVPLRKDAPLHAEEIVKVVNTIYTIQNRSMDDAELDLWDRALTPYPANAVRDAAEDLLINSTSFITPGLVTTAVRTILGRRLAEAGDPPIPGVSPDNARRYIDWIVQWRSSVMDGLSADDATRTADEWAHELGILDEEASQRRLALAGSEPGNPLHALLANTALMPNDPEGV